MPLYKLGYNLGMQGSETAWCWEGPCGHVGHGCNESKNCARNSSICKIRLEYQMMAEHKEFVQVNNSAGLHQDEKIMPNKKLLSQPTWSLALVAVIMSGPAEATNRSSCWETRVLDCRHSAIEGVFPNGWAMPWKMYISSMIQNFKNRFLLVLTLEALSRQLR